MRGTTVRTMAGVPMTHKGIYGCFLLIVSCAAWAADSRLIKVGSGKQICVDASAVSKVGYSGEGYTQFVSGAILKAPDSNSGKVFVEAVSISKDSFIQGIQIAAKREPGLVKKDAKLHLYRVDIAEGLYDPTKPEDPKSMFHQSEQASNWYYVAAPVLDHTDESAFVAKCIESKARTTCRRFYYVGDHLAVAVAVFDEKALANWRTLDPILQDYVDRSVHECK